MRPPPGSTVPFWPPYSSASAFDRQKPPQRHPATHDQPKHATTLATSLRQAAIETIRVLVIPEADCAQAERLRWALPVLLPAIQLVLRAVGAGKVQVAEARQLADIHAYAELAKVARVIEWCEPARDGGRGHPPTETMRVLATLRRFLREGTPWKRLRAMQGSASGSTLPRRLADWARTGVLRHVHSMLAGMLRGQPDLARDLVVDSCSVRAKCGGDLTGPNPTDRVKKETKYHVAVSGEGLPVACVATAANVNDTTMFERLFRAAFAVMVRVRTAFADKSYDAEAHRDLCRSYRTEPRLHKRGQPPGSGLGKRRWPVERANAWLLENKRLGLSGELLGSTRHDRLGFIVESLLQAACIFLVASRLAREF